ncbi:putative RNA exonuclease pqe-1 [Ditylenchus destructor]|uniref:RNA exonuclease pqe-1 n=1 Tax=Ditylenchus destructor TaxID=166010 RepID=A0AAD4MPF2_9BILA|nr:putative RNA exonuclease pqe-1 [Ditylenchus destructor]
MWCPNWLKSIFFYMTFRVTYRRHRFSRSRRISKQKSFCKTNVLGFKISFKFPEFDLNRYIMNLPEENAELQKFHDSLQQFVPTEEELRKSGYPLWVDNSKQLVAAEMDERNNEWRPFVDDDSLDRTCSRCRHKYTLLATGDQSPGTDCTFHWEMAKRIDKESDIQLHGCCKAVKGSPGCVQNHHHEAPPSQKGIDCCPGVYAFDCEMVYTIWGPALAQVSLVDYKGRPVLNEIVRPEDRLLDSNYRYTGLTLKDVENATCNLKQAREKFFQLVNSETILIGHSLENDLKTLRVVHKKVVDTALVFRHPTKNFNYSLKNLVKYHLNRSIQNGEGGHDSKEDALACLELMQHKIKPKTKPKNKPFRKHNYRPNNQHRK